MPLSYKSRRRLSVLILLLGLPLYIGLALYILSLFERPSIWIELGIYTVLGVLWAFPLRAVFRGVGQADPGQD